MTRERVSHWLTFFVLLYHLHYNSFFCFWNVVCWAAVKHLCCSIAPERINASYESAHQLIPVMYSAFSINSVSQIMFNSRRHCSIILNNYLLHNCILYHYLLIDCIRRPVFLSSQTNNAVTIEITPVVPGHKLFAMLSGGRMPSLKNFLLFTMVDNLPVIPETRKLCMAKSKHACWCHYIRMCSKINFNCIAQ